MVGLFFCKHTSSRIKKAWLIDHGSWYYKLSKAVPAQHCWLMVPVREALKFLGSSRGIWNHWALGSAQKRGNGVILTMDQVIQKASYSTFLVCDGEYFSFEWASFTFNSIFSVFHREHRHTELKSCAAESLSHTGWVCWMITMKGMLILGLSYYLTIANSILNSNTVRVFKPWISKSFSTI